MGAGLRDRRRPRHEHRRRARSRGCRRPRVRAPRRGRRYRRDDAHRGRANHRDRRNGRDRQAPVTRAGHLLPDRRLLSTAMLGVASGAILVPLNSTMLAVALPDVMGEFALGANEVSSLVTLYLGAVAVALPVGGSIGDRFGHRRAFLVGVVAFAGASLLAALATSFEVLEVSRVGQAASGALISTSSAALIRESAPPDRTGEAFGLFDLLVST